ncbi:hypothetical protein [Lysinibacillus boronitolerans]|uniref:hypothetical protein n=1 Tax=Lysinibacillus boronitolerans TaxID=309788 RepID=UPI0038548BF0
MNELLNINLTDIILVMATLTNVWIVFLVYKLTRKDINPILHLVPIKRKPIDNNYEDEEYSIFDAYDGFSNVVNHDINIDFDQRGFPDESQYHAPLLWELQIHNNGEHTATFVELEYEIIIYKVDMTFGTDEADVIDEKYVPYRTIKRKETFEYLAPKDNRVFKVLYLRGEFIQADLVVTSLKSKEIEHITSRIVIDKYTQPMLQWLSDSYHHRQVIGTHKPVK